MKKTKIIIYTLAGGLLFYTINSIILNKSQASNQIENSEVISKQNNVNFELPNFENAAAKAIKSVVHIKSKFLQNSIYRYYDPFFGNRYFKQPKEEVASGSGVIISSDGYIITNKHVINKATEIEVVLNDKRTYNAKILGTDPNSDLALLKVEANNLDFLDFANSDNIKIGQWVLAVGNPFNLSSTVTAGIISAKSRKINILNDGGIEAFIQTDAAINAGNSGGALVNTYGQLIGINTAIQSNTGSFTGYGFAIPSNMAQKIVSDLKKYGEVKRAYIGIHISDINNDIKEYFSLNGLNGVLVSKVLSNSAAEKAGIKDLDVILAINNITVNSVSELHEIIVQFSPGDEIKCKIKRGKKTIDLSFNLQE